MSSWSMNDGSDLTGTITTNTSSGTQMNVAGSGTAFTTEVAVGDVILTAGGNSYRVKSITSNTALVLTENVTSAESGVAADVRRPPLDFDSAAPHINTNILGITSAESLGGLDNITSVNVGDTTLGTLTTIGGNTYRGSAPTVTIAGPTARTILAAKITTASNSIEIAGHGIRTGTKLTFGHGSGTQNTGLTNGTTYFAIRVDDDNIKLGLNLANAQAGTAVSISGQGNNTQSLTGVTATATATISGGKVTGYTISEVGSDYQSAPSVTVAAPTGSGSLDLTDSAVLIVADDEIVIPNAMYTTISTGEAVTYTQGASGAQADLTTGTVYYLIKSGTTDKISLATTYANAVAGTKITLSAVASGGTAHTLIGGTATATANLGLGNDDSNDSREIAHIGWVKKTVGTGGRAGRVSYETLVAASSISGDAAGDTAAPDS